ncbi:uncharacterized protein KY384_007367 [Bacidia gigantensis]|uniref:uncharacterized protein n=1 Tax=Bacidia gigantensis TaxID=2732470 RepID=UPI001D05B5B2|nr:uncharacterized protein KY384_007367 [Bacidia gigantensis]KAG8528449.1 hypothetical protein KY384_007367 [Bacidia gigantensis]
MALALLQIGFWAWLAISQAPTMFLPDTMSDTDNFLQDCAGYNDSRRWTNGIYPGFPTKQQLRVCTHVARQNALQQTENITSTTSHKTREVTNVQRQEPNVQQQEPNGQHQGPNEQQHQPTPELDQPIANHDKSTLQQQNTKSKNQNANAQHEKAMLGKGKAELEHDDSNSKHENAESKQLDATPYHQKPNLEENEAFVEQNGADTGKKDVNPEEARGKIFVMPLQGRKVDLLGSNKELIASSPGSCSPRQHAKQESVSNVESPTPGGTKGKRRRRNAAKDKVKFDTPNSDQPKKHLDHQDNALVTKIAPTTDSGPVTDTAPAPEHAEVKQKSKRHGHRAGRNMRKSRKTAINAADVSTSATSD